LHGEHLKHVALEVLVREGQHAEQSCEGVEVELVEGKQRGERRKRERDRPVKMTNTVFAEQAAQTTV
jgi:hypothetical protein